MAIDERTDPVQIIARLGATQPPRRAMEVWMHLTAKAGWDVTQVEGAAVDRQAGECGIVEVEGLRYLIRQGRRVRGTLYDDTGGTVTRRPTFFVAAWAEPVLAPDSTGR